MEVRGQSLHHGSGDETQAFRLVWQVPLSAEPFVGFHLRLSSSSCILLATHMAYCILISCWVDLPVTHICIICRLVIMLFIPFLYGTFNPDIFLLVRLIMEELDNTADWCWGTVCLVFVISQGSLFCCFNVMSKIAVHVLKLKDFLQLFFSASSFLFPHVDLSLLFVFFFFFCPYFAKAHGLS